MVPLDRLWHDLPADERQQVLDKLSQMIAKQLPAPLAEREVRHENC